MMIPTRRDDKNPLWMPDYDAIAASHEAADKACGREWTCQCGACRLTRFKRDGTV